ncbi:hypothetical protein ACHAQA_005211 [Verticillium albo-atrum]
MRLFAHLVALAALAQAAMSLTTKPPHGKYVPSNPKNQWINATDVNFVDKRPAGHRPFCHWRNVEKWTRYDVWIPDGDRESLGQSVEEFCDKMEMEADGYTVCGLEVWGRTGRGRCTKYKNGVIWQRDAVRDCKPALIEEAIKSATIPNTPIRCVGDVEIVDKILEETINPT